MKKKNVYKLNKNINNNLKKFKIKRNNKKKKYN